MNSLFPNGVVYSPQLEHCMGDAPDPKDPLVGRTIEKCRILSPIARGGMGVVYLAEHTSLHRRVALKVLPSELAGDRTYITRFMREAVSAARMEHPNIVQIYDVGEFEQSPFIVMQYVEGFTVAELMERSGRFSPQESARLAREVARGLAAAHAQGIVHRDIKPQNILVSSQGEVRISDFGIALDSESSAVSLTQGMVLGTPSYLSPEQAQGQRADARSDLYSLGATIYAMLTGHPPFSGDSPMAVLYKHVHDPVRRPSVLVKDIPRFLEDIVMRLLAKKPEDRYQTADEVARELDRVVQGTFPRARPEPLRAVARRTERNVVAAEPSPNRKPPRAALIALGAAVVLLIPALYFILPRAPEKPAPPPTAAAPPRPEAFPPPASKESPLVEKPPVPEPPPEAILEPDFAALYRSPGDIGLWDWSAGLAKNVSFLPDAIRVSLPAGDAREDEFLFLKASDLEEFTWRFHLRVEGKCPQVCVSRDLPKPGWALVGDNGRFPQGSWQAVELDVRADQVRITMGGRPEPPEALDPKTGPWQTGFLCPPGTDFEIRHPRLLVRKRHVIKAAVVEAPPPPPEPEKPAPIAVEAPPPEAPDPGSIPIEALQAISAHNYSQAAEALATLPGETPRKLHERVNAAIAVLRGAARSLRPGDALSLILRGGQRMDVECISANEKEIIIGIGGGQASYPWSQLHPNFAMDILKDSRSVPPLQKALFLLLEDNPVGALEQLGSEEAPGHREEMEDLALERVDPLIKDGKFAEAQTQLRRLKPLITGAERMQGLVDREERVELALAKTDLERARILIRRGKPAQAEILIAPLFKNARPHEVSALCQMLREAVLAQPARDLFDGATLQGWNLSGGSERAFRAADGVISAAAGGTGVAITHDQIAPARSLQFELKVRNFRGSGIAALGFLQRAEGEQLALNFTPQGIAITEASAGRWKERARKAVTVAGGAWFRVDFIVSGGQALIFLDGTLFWRGPSVEPSAVGFGTAFFFQNAEADLRHIRVGVPAAGR